MVAYYQASTGLLLPAWEWSVEETRRATSFFTSPECIRAFSWPNYCFLLRMVIFLESRKKQSTNGYKIFFQILVLLFGATAIRYSVSRGAMIAYFSWNPVSALACLVKKGCYSLFVVYHCLRFFQPSLRADIIRVASFQVDSGQSRLALYTGTAQLLKQSPLVGLGLASFADKFEEVRVGDFTEKLIYPHNIFLNFWSETGIIGLVAILWIMVIVIKIAWKKKSFDEADLFISALLVMFIHGLVDVNYFKNDLAMLTWVLLAGLAWGCQRRIEQPIDHS